MDGQGDSGVGRVMYWDGVEGVVVGLLLWRCWVGGGEGEDKLEILRGSREEIIRSSQRGLGGGDSSGK